MNLSEILSRSSFTIVTYKNKLFHFQQNSFGVCWLDTAGDLALSDLVKSSTDDRENTRITESGLVSLNNMHNQK